MSDEIAPKGPVCSFIVFTRLQERRRSSNFVGRIALQGLLRFSGARKFFGNLARHVGTVARKFLTKARKFFGMNKSKFTQDSDFSKTLRTPEVRHLHQKFPRNRFPRKNITILQKHIRILVELKRLRFGTDGAVQKRQVLENLYPKNAIKLIFTIFERQTFFLKMRLFVLLFLIKIGSDSAHPYTERDYL